MPQRPADEDKQPTRSVPGVQNLQSVGAFGLVCYCYDAETVYGKKGWFLTTFGKKMQFLAVFFGKKDTVSRSIWIKNITVIYNNW